MLLKFKAGRSGDDPELLGKGRNFEKGTLKPSLLLFENEKPQSDFQACCFFWLTGFTLWQSCESIVKYLFLGLKVCTCGIRHSILTTLVSGSRPVWLA